MNTNLIFSQITLADFESVIENTVKRVLDGREPITPATVPDELITRKETAQMLGVSLPTLHNWRKCGLIPSYRIATRIRYKRHEVQNCIDSGKTKKFGRF